MEQHTHNLLVASTHIDKFRAHCRIFSERSKVTADGLHVRYRI